MTDQMDKKAISCPKGTYAVVQDDLTINVILIGPFSIDNASGVIDAINRILSCDRSLYWKYLIDVSDQTVSTPEAESKFQEFLRFHHWISTLTGNVCKVAVVFRPSLKALPRAQLTRIFEKSDIDFRIFESKEQAISWIDAANIGV